MMSLPRSLEKSEIFWFRIGTKKKKQKLEKENKILRFQFGTLELKRGKYTKYLFYLRRSFNIIKYNQKNSIYTL